MKDTFFSLKGYEVNVAAECRRNLKKLGNFKLIELKIGDLPWEARGKVNTPLGVQEFFFDRGSVEILGGIVDDRGQVVRYPSCHRFRDPLEGIYREDVEGQSF
jgi:hypothetical protein